MVRPACLPRLLALLATLGFAAAGGAQTDSPILKQPTPATVTATTVAPADLSPAPQRERAISPGVAAALAASMPKYAPPPPKPPPVPEEDLPDLRETDKPKNTIVRLPKYVVREAKPPIFRDRDINTKEGLANIAMRRYLTDTDRALNRFTIPLFHPFSTNSLGSNEDRALAMYAEDERLKNMSDVADQNNMVMKSDASAGTKFKGQAQSSFMRWSDMGRSTSDSK